MRTAGLALLLSFAAAAPAMALGPHSGGERFAAVTIVAGEGVAVSVSNVPVLPPNRACPVAVSFFAGDGSQIGATKSLDLKPGVSVSIAAASPKPGLVRAVVSISDPSRASDCALKTALDVFDQTTGATQFLEPSDTCIGLGACAVELKP